MMILNSRSQDESRGSQGGAIGEHSNGIMSGRKLKKKRRSGYSGDAQGGSYSNHISEEHYRAMLGEHIQKYKRRVKNSSPSPASMQTGVPVVKNSLGFKDQKMPNYQLGGSQRFKLTSDSLNVNHSQKLNFHGSDFTPKYATDRLVSEPGYLDIGDGISYRIPPPYEKLAASLNLPSMSDICVEEFYLKGTLDLGSLAAMMASEKQSELRSQAGMGEPKPQYESLQARLKAQPANSSAQMFT
ncbi:hypothetical protein ACH5RR_005223 [Cinchona calisaya]|uniref:Uncharacterized protein n=1 Tax=Cinchona calisaya TaxID=153742 RepID=A0ABD3AKK5_9GENT